MVSSLEFVVGLLTNRAPAHVALEDLMGPHGTMLRTLQRSGFLAREPGRHPVPSCPHCGTGVPFRAQERFLCNRCASIVDKRHLLLWRVNVDVFLHWLASQLGCRGGVRPIDEHLWQLGTWENQGDIHECFYTLDVALSTAGKNKLATYRSAILFFGLARPIAPEIGSATCISLLEILQPGNTLRVVDRTRILHDRSDIRFDVRSGVVTVGEAWQGEVPPASKEYFFLLCLFRHLDQFVAYADIKHFVLKQSGGNDSTEEATFCHRLKHRIKGKGWIPKIDLLLATTNKGDGYRLRATIARAEEA